MNHTVPMAVTRASGFSLKNQFKNNPIITGTPKGTVKILQILPVHLAKPQMCYS